MFPKEISLRTYNWPSSMHWPTIAVILNNLPGPRNYHTNMAAFGSDGKLYFSQGALTKTGIAGLHAYELRWLCRLPRAHDIPGMT
jgi:glucose/arabinose dehydrogenase